jgi:hypothetical protein
VNDPVPTVGLADATPAQLRERLSAALAAAHEVVVPLAGCERLPVDVCAVLLALAAEHRGRIRVRGAVGAVARALAVLDAGAALVVDGAQRPIVGDRPYAIAFPAPGVLSLRLQREAGSHRLLAEAIGHDWLRGVFAERLCFDLGELTHINSLLIAWLIQASQAGAPARVELVNVHAQAAIQLGQLRLTHLLPIVTG